MAESDNQRAKLADVAHAAGVSTATVDRVLHGRAGVHERTVKRVLNAASKLSYRPETELAAVRRRATQKIAFLLPADSSRFVRDLGDMVDGARADANRHTMVCRSATFPNFDPQGLVERLHELGRRCDGIVVMAFEHPSVREAIGEMSRQGLPIVTLISDVANSGRAAYVGLDNRAAGRTAGFLLGRLVGRERAGKVAMMAGSMRYRAHEEREIGFLGQLRESFPQLEIVGRLEGMENPQRTYEETRALLTQYPMLDAIYNVGGASDGVGKALKEAGRSGKTVFIGHGLAPETRTLLIDGTLDAVLTHDPRTAMLDCMRIFANLREKRDPLRGVEDTRCVIVLRDNLP